MFTFQPINFMKNGINRIRLEFKESLMSGADLKMKSINRIRLEFKAVTCNNAVTCYLCINRIRLEFKAYYHLLFLLKIFLY